MDAHGSEYSARKHVDAARNVKRMAHAPNNKMTNQSCAKSKEKMLCSQTCREMFLFFFFFSVTRSSSTTDWVEGFRRTYTMGLGGIGQSMVCLSKYVGAWLRTTGVNVSVVSKNLHNTQKKNKEECEIYVCGVCVRVRIEIYAVSTWFLETGSLR